MACASYSAVALKVVISSTYIVVLHVRSHHSSALSVQLCSSVGPISRQLNCCRADAAGVSLRMLRSWNPPSSAGEHQLRIEFSYFPTHAVARGDSRPIKDRYTNLPGVRAQANPNCVHASSAPGTAHHASRHAAQTRVPRHLDSCPFATYSWELLCGYALGCAGARECHPRNRKIEVNSITFCLCRLGTSHGTSTRKTNPLGSRTKTVVVAAHLLLQTGGYGRPTRQLQVSTSDHPLIMDQYVGCALYAAYVPGSFRTAYTQSRRRRHRHISCSATPQRRAFPGIAIRVLPIHTRGNAARLPFAHICPLCVLFFNIQLSTSPPLHLSTSL
jgi:hypothetical protein